MYPGRHKCIQGDISVSRALENTFTVTECVSRKVLPRYPHTDTFMVTLNVVEKNCTQKDFCLFNFFQPTQKITDL